MGVHAMSKKFPKQSRKRVRCESARKAVNHSEIGAETAALEQILGRTNVKRWLILKAAFACETNPAFVAKLLDLAQDFLDRKSIKDNRTEVGHDAKITNNFKTKRKKKAKKETKPAEIKKETADETTQEIQSLSVRLNKKEKIEEKPPLDISDITRKKPSIQIFAQNPDTKTCDKTDIVVNQIRETPNRLSKKCKEPPSDVKSESKKKKIVASPEKTEKPAEKPVLEVKKIKSEFDGRKAPVTELKSEPEKGEKPPEKPSEKSSSKTKHSTHKSRLNSPNQIIPDAITLADFEATFDPEEPEESSLNFAQKSLPDCLQIADSNTDHGAGIFAKIGLETFTQFGPLLGKHVKEVDVPEDSTMRDLWEIQGDSNKSGDGKCCYLNTEDANVSNWMRFVRPAPQKDDRNVTVNVVGNCLYFVTTRAVNSGEELLYWQDSMMSGCKKKLEKTSCGGCNMTFAHPLYYRVHCSVFHDVRYSLTIRKYHCKVCGAAVLGKENIMKHAAELHNGQGAYQCQYCRKFFLRLNYLEMHRTYGCSANPHRSRPLCDFCGRKFCQPQKLKVHIKRMHSDISEVLKEFQCKSCLKILGSRAALQRHLKEVHQKQLDGTCSCNRCGKHFQNKSNLKIHMLTHSGIKPFKCTVKSCNAAFTTKQCLQFHYKKVHAFSEDRMPKIERSIDYTFEAYSGVEDQDEKGDDDPGIVQNDSINATMDEEDTDEEDTNSLDGETKQLDSSRTAPESPLQYEHEDVTSPATTAAPNDPDTISKNMDIIDSYSVNTGPVKILSKGSKKWICDYSKDNSLSLGNTKLDFSTTRHHEPSNASLLVEAALDSVCSEPNIDIDVASTPTCSEALVTNLYLGQNDTLPEVSYAESDLISPSDHISVTDELNDELTAAAGTGMDYSNFQHGDEFTPTNSPDMQQQRASFVRSYINTLGSPGQYIKSPGQYIKSPGQYIKSPTGQYMESPSGQYPKSPNNGVPSPPRYDFGHNTNSEDSNGMAAQNLSLHGSKHHQVDYMKYKLAESAFPTRKKLQYANLMDDSDNPNPLDDEHNDPQIQDPHGLDEKEDDRVKYADDLGGEMIRHKFDLDLDLRLKSYEMENESRRGLYEADLEFRKSYELVEGVSVDTQRNSAGGTMESGDFRADRNFEPLLLNGGGAELQGLDMSARSFHNYPNINRYHHLYPEVDRLDLRINYSPPPPPPPTYTHADILRVVSLDLTPPGRHSVDLSLRTHPLHQISTSHRLLDPQSRLLGSELSGRLLSDHTTNRILSSNDQLPPPPTNHLLGDEARLLEQSRLSPIAPFGGYAVSQSPYHPTPLPARPPHVTSPTANPYHHYSTYY